MAFFTNSGNILMLLFLAEGTLLLLHMLVETSWMKHMITRGEDYAGLVGVEACFTRKFGF